MKINSISPDKHKYLQIVEDIAKPPKILYVKGGLPLQRVYSVAIVGTRKPSVYGIRVACDLAESLAKSGITIISGLAYGIDAEAHRGALKAQGITISVMAGGLDVIYPARHEQLAERIVQSGGALISEYSEGQRPMKHHFLERNRLVSGLADAIVVVEAARRSGTLATVMHALEQGKEVFAVPGPITSEVSAGPNTLIKQGAHPVTSADDILEVIAPHLIQAKQLTVVATFSSNQQAIIDVLKQGYCNTGQLQAASQLDVTDFFQTVTELEVSGHIKSTQGNQWTLT